MASGTINQVVNANRNIDRTVSYELSLNGSQNGMAIVIKDYSYAASQSGSIGAVGTQSNAKASILMPLPGNLQDAYNINIGQNEIGAMGQIGIAGSTGGVGNLLSSAGSAVGDLLTNTLGALNSGNAQSAVDTLSTARAYASYVGKNAADFIPGGNDVVKGIDVGTGTVVNPHAALTFSGVSLKAHSFEWKLSPKNLTEANTIRDIAKTLKKASLPKYAGAGEGILGRALLQYPSLVEMKLVGVNREHFYTFKPALIQNITVSYAPEGVVLNRGGIPSSVLITMSILEAQIHTKDDIV